MRAANKGLGMLRRPTPRRARLRRLIASPPSGRLKAFTMAHVHARDAYCRRQARPLETKKDQRASTKPFLRWALSPPPQRFQFANAEPRPAPLTPSNLLRFSVHTRRHFECASAFTSQGRTSVSQEEHMRQTAGAVGIFQRREAATPLAWGLPVKRRIAPRHKTGDSRW